MPSASAAARAAEERKAATRLPAPSAPTRSGLVGTKVSSASSQAKAQQDAKEARLAKEKAEREAAEAAKSPRANLPPVTKASDVVRKLELERLQKKEAEAQRKAQEEREKAEKAAEEAARLAAEAEAKISKASVAAKKSPTPSTRPSVKKRHGKQEVIVRELLDAETMRPVSLLHDRAESSQATIQREERVVRFRAQSDSDRTTFVLVLYRDPEMLEKHIENEKKRHGNAPTVLFYIFLIVVGGGAPEAEKAYGFLRQGRVQDEQTLLACLNMPQGNQHLGVFNGEKAYQNTVQTALALAKELKTLYDKGIVLHGSLSPAIINIGHTEDTLVSSRPLEGESGIREIIADKHAIVTLTDLSASSLDKDWCAPELHGLVGKSWAERTMIDGNTSFVKDREQADIFGLGAIMLALCDASPDIFTADGWWVGDRLNKLVLEGRRAARGHVSNLRILAELLAQRDSGVKGKIKLQRVVDYLSGSDPNRIMMSDEQAKASRAGIVQFLLSSTASTGSTK